MIIADLLTDSLLGGILLVAITSAVGLWGRTRKLEQSMFNGVERRLDKIEEVVDWIYKDILAQARMERRPVPVPIPRTDVDGRIPTEVPERP